MSKLKYLAKKIGYIINYFYYFRASIIKNTFPCKLLGEKLNIFEGDSLILFKILGKKENYSIPLSRLLDSKQLIEGFHPLEATKLGSLAFKDTILKLPKDEIKNEFNKVKHIMLGFAPAYLNTMLEDKEAFDMPKEIYSYLNSAVTSNLYPYKLVGGKLAPNKDNTIIVYTIFGKRDGHEKLLQDIIENSNLLAKFHPAEAIKLGFIYAGENFLAFNKDAI
ncbi:MAG: hypothetical protein EPO11_09445 [Gammaproteobacteria bacterium]|nr:MAG: hypothetical protein EPO11_09445 [Gammaproteobacteria bacterium]